MCRGWMGCIIIPASIIYLFSGLALAVGGGLVLWNPQIRGIMVDEMVRGLQDASTQTTPEEIRKTAEQLLSTLTPGAIGMFCVGILIAVVSIMAFVGVCCYVNCMLIAFMITTCVLVLGLLIVILTYFTNKQLFMSSMYSQIENYEKKYESLQSTNPDSRNAAVIMMGWKCCGYNNGEDFKNTGYSFTKQENGTTMNYPAACCKPGLLDQCKTQFTAENSYIGTGCKTSLESNLLPTMDKFMYGLVGALLANIIMVMIVVAVVR